MNFSDYSGRWDRNRGVIDCARWLAGVVVTIVVAFTAAAAFGLMFGGCANTERALEHAKDNAALSQGHAQDVSLPVEAQAIGAVNRVSWQVQVYLLGGPKPDPDVIDMLPEETRAELGLLENSETAK